MIQIIARSKHHKAACGGCSYSVFSERRAAAVMVGTLTNDKKAAREVVMPVDWILSSVAVIGVLAFVAVLLFVDFKPRSL